MVRGLTAFLVRRQAARAVSALSLIAAALTIQWLPGLSFAAAAAPASAPVQGALVRSGGPNWAQLSTSQRKALAPLEKDWAGIDAAFEANKDPWSGPTGEFRALFSRIVAMVPAPYGVGPA